jgi:hexokinase
MYKLPMINRLDISTLRSIQLDFYKELEEGMSGEKTSLPFIIHSLSPTPLVSEDEDFQVMVVGGSVFKKAIGKKKKGKIYFSNKGQSELSIIRTKEDFISLVERNLDPNVRVVALNFAYPLRPILEKDRLDGVLLSGTKEHTFTGLIGKKVGQELEEYFDKKYKRKIVFTVANDTVCLLLSGLNEVSWEKLACGIVGTGVNFAYFLENEKLVNLESANFDKFPISAEAHEIDMRSTKVGKALFEKETAGSYLYQHFNAIVEKRGLPFPKVASTWELKKLAMLGSSQASEIAISLIKKSAGLIATQIAGIVLFKQRDMIFVMEGSFFWGENIYREYVEGFLKVLIPERKITFISVNESHFAGAAKLVS